uniref:Centromere protein K n=1 Tax=Echeneis naucrates TaxID=173247 RepID=A0A665V6U8_ECHNA
MPNKTALLGLCNPFFSLCVPQMLKLCSELEMVLSCCEAKRDKLRETKELYAKIQKMKVYLEKLMESLGDVLQTHVPLPQIETSTNKKKKKIELGLHEDLISLNEILEVLMNKILNSPHDPYVTIDHTFWPPYIEMLLRYGIAVRHQENNFKIRLETFF